MKNHIKDTLIDLALKTRDFEWISNILSNSYDMTPIVNLNDDKKNYSHKVTNGDSEVIGKKSNEITYRDKKEGEFW